MSPPNHRCRAGSYLRNDKAKGGCSPLCSRPKRGELSGRACHLPRVHAAMQHTNRGGVEGTGTCRAAWRPLTSGETRMPSERPYPGQLWKHDSMHVIVVAVHPNTVTYEFLSGGQSVTQSLDVFLAVFTRLRRCRSSPVHTSYAPESDP